MARKINVTIPVSEATARMLADPAKLQAAGVFLSHWVRSSTEAPFDPMNPLSAEAAARGPTDGIPEEELAAHQRERLR